MMKLWLELALVLLVVIDRQSPYILFTNVLRVCVCVFLLLLLLMQLPRVECQRVSGENRKGGIYRDALSTSRTFMRLF